MAADVIAKPDSAHAGAIEPPVTAEAAAAQANIVRKSRA
jgi:hypothetical protein